MATATTATGGHAGCGAAIAPRPRERDGLSWATSSASGSSSSSANNAEASIGGTPPGSSPRVVAALLLTHHPTVVHLSRRSSHTPRIIKQPASLGAGVLALPHRLPPHYRFAAPARQHRTGQRPLVQEKRALPGGGHIPSSDSCPKTPWP
ncbi:hypothetical protein [Streptomyces mirabilis]|uniref:hypothetical protein n=1 Tax=Streptomyces mirabilis TaxID=68239 RepID=UPI00367D8594